MRIGFLLNDNAYFAANKSSWDNLYLLSWAHRKHNGWFLMKDTEKTNGLKYITKGLIAGVYQRPRNSIHYVTTS